MMKWTKMIDEVAGLGRQRNKLWNNKLWCDFSYAATATLLEWEEGGNIEDSEERAFVRRYANKDHGSCYEVRWGEYNGTDRCYKVLFDSGLNAAKAEAVRQHMTYNRKGGEGMKIGTVALLKSKTSIEEVLVIDVSSRHVLLFSDTLGELGWVKKELILDVVDEPDAPEVSDESHMDIFLVDYHRFIGEEVGTRPTVGEQVKWALEMDGAELTVTGYVLNVYTDGQGVQRATCSERGVSTYNKYWEVPLSRLL